MKPLHETTDETIFSDGEAYFASLRRDIANAKQSIELETYTFNKDMLGKAIADELLKAANRGVEVRILVDGAGTPQWGGSFAKNLENAGIQTRIFHPFPWRLWQWSRSVVHVPSILKAIYLCLKINSRNHRKVCLIDKNIAYAGSFNVSQCHLSKADHGEGWRDTGIRLRGNNMSTLTSAFETAWTHMPAPERLREYFRQVNKNPTIRLNNTRRHRRVLYKNLLRRMSLCEQRIWITNAYFVPDNFLLKKLKDAARAGTDVRILLPKKSDVPFIPWASTTFFESLLKSGVRIFEYIPSVLHAKTLILDEWMMLGSSNLNHRSIMHDLEVDIHVRLPSSKKAIEHQFLEDLDQAKEVHLNSTEKRPLYQRTIGRLLLYLKYWI